MSSPKDSPNKIKPRQRALEGLRLRKLGYTYQEIANRVDGWSSESSARKAVQKLLSRIEFEAVDEYRTLQNMRLESLYREIRQDLYAGKDGRISLWGVDRLLSILDQQAKLLGLNMPQQMSIEMSWQIEAINAIRAGEIDYETLEAELGDAELAEKLFAQAGMAVTRED